MTQFAHGLLVAGLWVLWPLVFGALAGPILGLRGSRVRGVLAGLAGVSAGRARVAAPSCCTESHPGCPEFPSRPLRSVRKISGRQGFSLTKPSFDTAGLRRPGSTILLTDCIRKGSPRGPQGPFIDPGVRGAPPVGEP